MVELIHHKSHDYRQLLPLKDGLLRCINCGVVTPIKYISSNSKICILQASTKASGYLNESNNILSQNSLEIYRIVNKK